MIPQDDLPRPAVGGRVGNGPVKDRALLRKGRELRTKHELDRRFDRKPIRGRKPGVRVGERRPLSPPHGIVVERADVRPGFPHLHFLSSREAEGRELPRPGRPEQVRLEEQDHHGG